MQTSPPSGLAAETLRVSRERMGEIGRHLDRRLRWARRIRLGGQPGRRGGLGGAFGRGPARAAPRRSHLGVRDLRRLRARRRRGLHRDGGAGNTGGLAALRLRAASAIGRIATLDGETGCSPCARRRPANGSPSSSRPTRSPRHPPDRVRGRAIWPADQLASRIFDGWQPNHRNQARHAHRFLCQRHRRQHRTAAVFPE